MMFTKCMCAQPPKTMCCAECVECILCSCEVGTSTYINAVFRATGECTSPANPPPPSFPPSVFSAAASSRSVAYITTTYFLIVTIIGGLVSSSIIFFQSANRDHAAQRFIGFVIQGQDHRGSIRVYLHRAGFALYTSSSRQRNVFKREHACQHARMTDTISMYNMKSGIILVSNCYWFKKSIPISGRRLGAQCCKIGQVSTKLLKLSWHKLLPSKARRDCICDSVRHHSLKNIIDDNSATSD